MAMVTRNVGKLVANQTALLLCDMQEKFRPSIPYFDQIVQVSIRVLQAAKLLQLPIIVTEQYPKGLGRTVTELAQHLDGVQPVEKLQFSMFTDQVVAKLKENPQVKDIVLCGIETHVCVQGTVLDALEQNYNVHVVVDACASRSLNDRVFAYQRMQKAGAWLTTSESLILGLVGGASHPKFRECQKLILQPAPHTGLINPLISDTATTTSSNNNN